MFRRNLKIVALILGASWLVSCGSAASNDVTIGQSEGPTLAEAAANLPRPNVPIVVSNSGDNNADNVTITDQNTGVTTTTTSNSTSSASAGGNIMRRFLWKQESERDGNVVVLVDPPGIRVEVFGSISETLTDFGPSNDRGTTARGSFPGCSYGSNIVVEFFNSRGQRVGFVNGQNNVNIPDGCSRVEFNL